MKRGMMGGLKRQTSIGMELAMNNEDCYLSDEDLDGIFQGGFGVFKAGFSLSDNPWANYHSLAAQVWEDGWLDAEDSVFVY
jgi:hypothetical protein